MKWVMRIVWGYAIAVLLVGLVGFVYLRGESREWSSGFFLYLGASVVASLYGVHRGRKRRMKKDQPDTADEGGTND